MCKKFELRVSAGTMLLLAGLIISSDAAARCGYYAGYGYRCFGDEGGTGGKVFEQMDENTKKCGYWDPGCTKQSQESEGQPEPVTNENNEETRSNSDTWQRPQSDGGYRSPQIGPGYQAPGTNR